MFPAFLFRGLKQEGRKQGRKEATKEGRKQRRKEGRKKERDEGRKEERKEGREEGRKETKKGRKIGRSEEERKIRRGKEETKKGKKIGRKEGKEVRKVQNRMQSSGATWVFRIPIFRLSLPCILFFSRFGFQFLSLLPPNPPSSVFLKSSVRKSFDT